jgi:hypothetical protein
MPDALTEAAITLDATQRFQQMDGFGVNLNPKCWDRGSLAPVLDLLIDDLGATLFRVDAYGKSNWLDPDSSLGRGALTEETYARAYRGIDFQQAAASAGT